MIVRTILFKTWEPPKKPGRLVLNDDGVMYTRPKSVTGEKIKSNRASFGERVKQYQQAKWEATALRITNYILHNPMCSRAEIMVGVSMGKSAVDKHLKRLRDNGQLHWETRRVGLANEYRYRYERTA